MEWEAISIVIVIIGAVIGYVLSIKKQNKVSKLMIEIDSEYSNYKMSPKRCEAELYRIKEIIADEFKKGNIDSASFSVLDKRVNDYLDEIREQVINEKFKGAPANVRTDLLKALSDNKISEAEFKTLNALISKSKLSKGDKTKFEKSLFDLKKNSNEIFIEKKSFFEKTIGKVPWTKDRLAVFSLLTGIAITIISILGIVSSKGGSLILTASGIATIIGGYRILKDKKHGLLILSIAYWFYLVLCLLLLIGAKQPIAILFILFLATILYRLEKLKSKESISFVEEIKKRI